MENYVLSCCSTADLSQRHFQERDIHYICFHFYLNGRHYLDDLGKSISFPDFYKAMENGAETKTSQVNEEEFVQYFTPFLEAGRDILHVCLSSGISGVYNSAVIAQKALQEKYPERKIYIVDSLGASSGYGLFMDTLADLRDGGMGIDELRDWALQHRLNLHHWFFSTDLSFYVKGGRISKAAGLFGTVLRICPLLNMDHLGRLIPREKVRTKRKVIHRIVEMMQVHAKMVEQMRVHAQGGTDYNGKCFISQSACYEDARAVADLVEAAFPHLNGKVLINSIGTTIGSHTGPGTVALFFWGDERKD